MTTSYDGPCCFEMNRRIEVTLPTRSVTLVVRTERTSDMQPHCYENNWSHHAQLSLSYNFSLGWLSLATKNWITFCIFFLIWFSIMDHQSVTMLKLTSTNRKLKSSVSTYQAGENVLTIDRLFLITSLLQYPLFLLITNFCARIFVWRLLLLWHNRFHALILYLVPTNSVARSTWMLNSICQI